MPDTENGLPGLSLTAAEKDDLFNAACRSHSGPATFICRPCADAQDAVIERVIAARLAGAWREGAIAALDFSTRDDDGIGLSLDLEAHPNPYDARVTSPGVDQ